jgi:hypothetical protein
MEREVLLEKTKASTSTETEDRCLLHPGTRFTIVLSHVANIELQIRRCKCLVDYFENMAS